MSHHIDEEEFQEAVRAKDWGFIWAAYQYAVNGGETTTVERLKGELEVAHGFHKVAVAERNLAHHQLDTRTDEIAGLTRERDEAISERDGALIREEWAIAIEKERDGLLAEVEKLKEFQIANEKTIGWLKSEYEMILLKIAEEFHGAAIRARDPDYHKLEKGKKDK